MATPSIPTGDAATDLTNQAGETRKKQLEAKLYWQTILNELNDANELASK